jgi:ATP-dependent RNA helicase SUPV3L1/SUV3
VAAAEGGLAGGENRPQEGRRNPAERRPEGQPKPKFDRERFKRPPGKPDEGGPADQRQGRPQGDGRRRDGRADDKGERQQKPAFQPRPREDRPVQVDPLSPFAKLAALRDLLKK